MLFTQPSYTKEKQSGIPRHGYRFTHVEGFELTYHVNGGGYEKIPYSKYDRFLIVKKGLVEAKIGDRDVRLSEDDTFSVVPSTEINIDDSQYIHYLLTSKKGPIHCSKEISSGGWTSIQPVKDTVVIINRGSGFVEYDGKTKAASEGHVIEIPVNKKVKFSGKLEYYLLTSNPQ